MLQLSTISHRLLSTQLPGSERKPVNTRKITKVIIGVVAICTAGGYLLYEAFESGLAYCYPVDEFVECTLDKMSQNGDSRFSSTGSNRIIRLVGRVKDGSIVGNMEKMELNFELAGQRRSVAVRYNAAAPANFEAGKEVFVEGKIGSDGVFSATKILTRCESKYKVKLEKDSAYGKTRDEK